MDQKQWDDLRRRIEEHHRSGVDNHPEIRPEDTQKYSSEEVAFVGQSSGKNFKQLQDLVAQVKAKDEQLKEIGILDDIITQHSTKITEQTAQIKAKDEELSELRAMLGRTSEEISRLTADNMELRSELNNARPSLAHAVTDAEKYGAALEDIERLLKREDGVILLQWSTIRGKFVAFHHMATDMRGEGDTPVEALEDIWRTLRYHGRD